MKKQFIKTLSVVLLLIGAFMVLGGCEKKKENKNPLKNTEWKLVNFVDVANNTNKIPEPNSEMCYILKFFRNERFFDSSIFYKQLHWHVYY